jgi:hypothetical protein
MHLMAGRGGKMTIADFTGESSAIHQVDVLPSAQPAHQPPMEREASPRQD